MIRASTKRLVRSIFVLRCGYCSLSEDEIGAELTFDHFQPIAAGGSDEADNIVYACHACNEFKGEYWNESEQSRLLHPLRDEVFRHIEELETGILAGLTQLGENYIAQLKLNRRPLVQYRLQKRVRSQINQQFLGIDALLDQIVIRLNRIEKRKR